MQIALRNVVLAVAVVLAVHWAAWFYWDLSVDFDKALWEVAFGGIAGGIIGLLPDANKAQVKARLGAIVGSPKTTVGLVAFLATAFCAALLFSKTSVHFPAGTDAVSVNGSSLIGDTDQGGKSVKVFRPVYSAIDAQISDLHKTARTAPFFPSSIIFTESEVNTHLPLYKEVQDDLLLTFYQYFARNFLAQANSVFSEPAGQHFQELNEIYSILRRCFVDADLRNRIDMAIETYSAEHPQSVWLPLLRSCTAYSRRQYDEAAAELEDIPSSLVPEFRTTYLFFRGVNRLKSYSAQVVGHASIASKLGDKALADFDLAYAAASEHGTFFVVARQSNLIFKGITNVYLSQLEVALNNFRSASEGTHEGLKSRAFNDVGYVHMIRGDLRAAETAFNQALDVVGNFPIARVNLAYVEMGLGNFDGARTILQNTVSDPLTVTSY